MNQFKDWISDLESFVRPHGDPALTEPMSAYMKYRFPFLGIKVPQQKSLLKQFCKEHTWPAGTHLTEVIKGLYDIPEREFQMMALVVAIKARKQLTLEDQGLLWFMITERSWWDSVDSVASNLVGFVLQKHPEGRVIWNEKMIHSDNMWLRRTALIFQLKYKDEVDSVLLFDNIRETAHESDFFIRKAIGWSLRQYSKFNPDLVRQFISETSLSALSVREGSKYL